MAEDPKTRSLFLCVMDGHGEDGDKVSQNIKGKIANYLFNHRDFATDIKTAITEVVARCEMEILRESSIETDFSGTTLTCAVIRDNKCVLGNVGDSRTSIAYRGPNGQAIGVNLTIDHKPDLPAEKVRGVFFSHLPHHPTHTPQTQQALLTPLFSFSLFSFSFSFVSLSRISYHIISYHIISIESRPELKLREVASLLWNTTMGWTDLPVSGSDIWTSPASQ